MLLLHNIDHRWDSSDITNALNEVAQLETALIHQGHDITSVAVYDADLASLLLDYDPECHVVFNWCEELPGLPRSDALVAEILDMLQFAYTGSTSAVLELSWDKEKVKQLLERDSIPTPRWRIYNSLQIDGWDCFPAIVKPAFEHCSYGLSTEAVVLTPEELCKRIAYVLDVFHQPALVEDFIDGREFHVSLWGDGVIEMLPPAEMDFAAFGDIHDRLCTFDSKFRPGSSHYDQIQVRVPASLNEEEYRRLEREALKAYRVLGCRDYARLDIRLRDGVFYVLDVNPNADISSETSMAYAAKEAGYSYGGMISRLLHLAALRHPKMLSGLK